MELYNNNGDDDQCVFEFLNATGRNDTKYNERDNDFKEANNADYVAADKTVRTSYGINDGDGSEDNESTTATTTQ